VVKRKKIPELGPTYLKLLIEGIGAQNEPNNQVRAIESRRKGRATAGGRGAKQPAEKQREQRNDVPRSLEDF